MLERKVKIAQFARLILNYITLFQHHFDTADREEDPKVVFFVPTTALVQQQCTMFKTYLSDRQIVPVSGEGLEASGNQDMMVKDGSKTTHQHE